MIMMMDVQTKTAFMRPFNRFVYHEAEKPAAVHSIIIMMCVRTHVSHRLPIGPESCFDIFLIIKT